MSLTTQRTSSTNHSMNAASGGSPSGELTLGQRLAGKYMAFKLAQEEYALEILKVREIIGLMQITHVPRTEPHIRGVINLRGRIIPVLDLRLRFGMDSAEPTDQTVIIVVQCRRGHEETTMGLLVDEVLEVLSIDAEDIAPQPTFGDGSVDTGFIMGIGKVDSRVVFLLDIDFIISGESSATEFGGFDGQALPAGFITE